MTNYEDIYKKWELTGKVEDGDMPWIARVTPDVELIPEFLANKMDNTEDVCQVLEVVAFTNYLLRKHSSLIGALQKFIDLLLNKLETLARSVRGILFHIDVGVGIRVSITFQVSAVATK